MFFGSAEAIIAAATARLDPSAARRTAFYEHTSTCKQPNLRRETSGASWASTAPAEHPRRPPGPITGGGRVRGVRDERYGTRGAIERREHVPALPARSRAAAASAAPWRCGAAEKAAATLDSGPGQGRGPGPPAASARRRGPPWTHRPEKLSRSCRVEARARQLLVRVAIC